MEDAERAAEAALDVLDKAELATLDAEEREEEALEDFAIVSFGFEDSMDFGNRG